MGTYRFVLAALVLYSHAFGSVAGVNVGVVAVISFFVISGYVMSLLIEKTYPSFQDIPAFYADRAARLFPQYLTYLLATLLIAAVLDIKDPFLADQGPLYVLANVAMLPLGYFMYGLESALYVPPAWSLGLELTFYLIFPFFWLLPKIWKAVTIAVSVAISASAYLGVINSDFFGYRLLPGTFLIFIAGASLAYPRKIHPSYALGVACLMLAAFAALHLFPSLHGLPYNWEVTLGTSLGILAVMRLRKTPRTDIDEYLGNLSYGVFLSHYLMMWISDHYGISRWLAVPAGSIVCAALTYELVEKPALSLRRRMRNMTRLKMAVN